MSVGPEPVVLSFGRPADAAPGFPADLSAVTQVGTDLWLGSDEGTGIVRLSPTGPDAYGEAEAFGLHECLGLPGSDEEEIDVEGLGYAAGFLWLAGSHSRLRPNVKEPTDDPGRGLRRLGRVKRAGNRYLLARVPLADDESGAGRVPCRRGGAGGAARLPGGRRRNRLTDLLADDEHLARFLRIPGKDNGFNVEGLAAAEDRVLLGLRGPVLRGWAVLLVLAPEEHSSDPGTLRLARIGAGKRRYAKVFLDLQGLGIRDLALDGPDLLILAGPTMALRSDALVLRWRDALRARDDAFVPRSELERVLELPYGAGSEEAVDHPEGLAVLREGSARSLLVVYDSPAEARRRGLDGVVADRFRL